MGVGIVAVALVVGSAALLEGDSITWTRIGGLAQPAISAVPAKTTAKIDHADFREGKKSFTECTLCSIACMHL
jgi:hypothetical protein